MIYKEANTCVTPHFNLDYFDLHQHLLRNGDVVGSRNGSTREFLNFKTVIQEPIKRCIGGYNRNINVFFLLAEALWIWAGRRDVAFLDPFNSVLKDYSDDGINYHAPYGWRMRKYGVDSMQSFNDSNKHASQGIDQIAKALQLLNSNPEDRGVVIQIWEAEQDLGVTTLDRPCNDLVMFKIRQGKLYTTIANRSNDLNWGLTTNVFQFSFVGEIMSKILGVGLGDQVHNSQSLHVYLNNDLTNELGSKLSFDNNKTGLLYDKAEACSMDFSFVDDIRVDEKLTIIDFHIHTIIRILTNKSLNVEMRGDATYLDSLKKFSRYFYFVYRLLYTYLDYKEHKSKITALQALGSLANEMPEFGNNDYFLLAMNFFGRRITEKSSQADINYIKAIVSDSPSTYKLVSQY